jgi:hypothetical protein
MQICQLPYKSSLGYASGFNYSQYLDVGKQPRFHIEGVAEIVDERVDPIISPGADFSAHSHAVLGNSMFNTNLTYEQTQEANCTSISIAADHSSYWVPSIYVGVLGKDVAGFTDTLFDGKKAYNGTHFQRINPGYRFYYLMSHWVRSNHA